MYYTNKQKTTIVSFTIKKVIEYRNDELAYLATKNLKELQQKKDTFGDIIIPDFDFEVNDNTLWYESVFVKGNPISNSEMNHL